MGKMIEISAILHPTDFSDLSLQALGYAEFLARKVSAKLHCLHVVDDSYRYWLATDIVTAPVGPPVDELIARGRKQLDEFVAGHVGKDIETVKVVRPGRPFLEIIRYAREHSIELVVMGTHGRTGLKHVLMGSVAERVVRKSPCPVLTVRSPDHGFEMP